MALRIVICLLMGYLFGSFSTSYIIGKLNKVDIRNYGSGNAGTTNAFRTLGKKAGIITFIGDFLKVIIAILLVRLVIFRGTDYIRLLELITGFGCVIGHNFPVWLGFHGGKGIAVTSGAFLIIDPLIIPVGVPIFAIIVLTTKYVSLGSLVIATIFPVWVALRFPNDSYYLACIAVAVLFTLSAFYQHRANIKRLLNGTENKIGHHVNINEPQEAMNKGE